jgi:hypothetical protein
MILLLFPGSCRVSSRETAARTPRGAARRRLGRNSHRHPLAKELEGPEGFSLTSFTELDEPTPRRIRLFTYPAGG